MCVRSIDIRSLLVLARWESVSSLGAGGVRVATYRSRWSSSRVGPRCDLRADVLQHAARAVESSHVWTRDRLHPRDHSRLGR